MDTPLTSFKRLFAPDLLAGKVAFITGGGSGIGFRITEMLMRHGCDVAIASRNVERLTAAAKSLESAAKRTCLPVKMDVRKPENVKDALQACIQRFGRLDIVINCAAGNFLCAAGGLSPNAFRTVLEIDTVGTFNVCRLAHELWLGAHGGVIVNVTATLDYRGTPLQAHAGAAKAAIDALSRHLAREWGPHGIRVNSIAPGPIGGTEGFDRLGGFMPKPALDAYISSIPLQRVGETVDIANGVLYLCSDAGAYVSGTVLVVDGGAWMGDVPSDAAILKDSSGSDETAAATPRSKL